MRTVCERDGTQVYTGAVPAGGDEIEAAAPCKEDAGVGWVVHSTVFFRPNVVEVKLNQQCIFIIFNLTIEWPSQVGQGETWRTFYVAMSPWHVTLSWSTCELTVISFEGFVKDNNQADFALILALQIIFYKIILHDYPVICRARKRVVADNRKR